MNSEASNSGIRIAVASDHAGFAHKEAIKSYLAEKNFGVQDFGADSTEPCDYPQFILPAARAVAAGTCQLGIVVGGSGNGEQIAANKVCGIRCALVWSVEIARLARSHNNANMISFGARFTPVPEALAMLEKWLATPFEAGRHQQRLEQITQAEKENFDRKTG